MKLLFKPMYIAWKLQLHENTPSHVANRVDVMEFLDVYDACIAHGFTPNLPHTSRVELRAWSDE